MPTAFEELEGSPVVEINDGKFTGTRRFKIAWSDTIAFNGELIGSWAASGSTLVFVPGAPFPGIPQAICRSVRYDPFPAENVGTPCDNADVRTSNTNRPLCAIVTATYSILDITPPDIDDPEDGTRLTINSTLGHDVVSFPGRAVKFQETPNEVLPEDAAVNVVVPTEEMLVRWERLPRSLVPWNNLRSKIGKVNSSTWYGYPSETVLFTGVTDAREYQFSGDILMTLEFRFSAKVIKTATSSGVAGWNHRFDERSGRWKKVITATGDNPIYQTVSFSDLFRF